MKLPLSTQNKIREIKNKEKVLHDAREKLSKFLDTKNELNKIEDEKNSLRIDLENKVF